MCILRPFSAVNYCGLEHRPICVWVLAKKLPLYGCRGNIFLLSAFEEGIIKTSTISFMSSTTSAILLMDYTCIYTPPMTTTAAIELTSSLKVNLNCCATAMHCWIVGSERIRICLLLRTTPYCVVKFGLSEGCGAKVGKKRWLTENLFECFLNLPFNTTWTPYGKSVAFNFLPPTEHSTTFSFNLLVLSSISNSSFSS